MMAGMDLGIAGRRAVVTGATRGIGREVARPIDDVEWSLSSTCS